MRNIVLYRGVEVGYIEDNIYYSNRNREHIFRKFENGFGLSVKIIDFLESEKVEKVCIVFENVHKFECDLSLFYLKGFTYFDGEDEQLILPNKFFNQKKLNEAQEHLCE